MKLYLVQGIWIDGFKTRYQRVIGIYKDYNKACLIKDELNNETKSRLLHYIYQIIGPIELDNDSNIVTKLL